MSLDYEERERVIQIVVDNRRRRMIKGFWETVRRLRKERRQMRESEIHFVNLLRKYSVKERREAMDKRSS